MEYLDPTKPGDVTLVSEIPRYIREVRAALNEFSIDPSNFWSSGGIYVGVESPGLVTYEEWLLTKEGFWGWIDTSGDLTGSVVSKGGIVFGGASLVNAVCGIRSTGGIVLGGTSDVTSGSVGSLSVSVNSSGGLIFGGSSSVSSATTVVSHGGVVLGGATSISTAVSIGSQGGLVFGGASVAEGVAATVTQNVNVSASGGLVFGGSSATSVGKSISSMGGIVIGGTSAASGGAPDYFGTGNEGWTLNGFTRGQDAGNWMVSAAVFVGDDGEGGWDYTFQTADISKAITLTAGDVITVSYKVSGVSPDFNLQYLNGSGVTQYVSVAGGAVMDGAKHTASFTIPATAQGANKTVTLAVATGGGIGDSATFIFDDIKKNGVSV